MLWDTTARCPISIQVSVLSIIPDFISVKGCLKTQHLSGNLVNRLIMWGSISEFRHRDHFPQVGKMVTTPGPFWNMQHMLQPRQKIRTLQPNSIFRKIAPEPRIFQKAGKIFVAKIVAKSPHSVAKSSKTKQNRLFKFEDYKKPPSQ